MLPASVVTFKWKPMDGYRSHFGAEQVNVAKRMVARHFQAPHRFICVTDDPVGLDPDVEVVELWPDYARVPSPHGGKNPSCYRRLRVFKKDIGALLGPRFVVMDLDVVILDNLMPLWDRPEDFVIWGDYTNPHTVYNGSMFMLTAGARSQVWAKFDPQTSPHEAKAAGCWGSDQGWISFLLGTGEARWTRADGLYSFRNDIAPQAGKLPAGARVVMFHGAHDPWGEYAQRLPWVREHWR